MSLTPASPSSSPAPATTSFREQTNSHTVILSAAKDLTALLRCETFRCAQLDKPVRFDVTAYEHATSKLIPRTRLFAPYCQPVRAASHCRATSPCAAWNARSVGRPSGAGSSDWWVK